MILLCFISVTGARVNLTREHAAEHGEWQKCLKFVIGQGALALLE